MERVKAKRPPSRAQLGRWVHDILAADADLQEAVDGLASAAREDERLREIDNAIDLLTCARAAIDATLGDLKDALPGNGAAP